MFRALVRILLCILVILGLFWFLNTDWKEFKKDIELQNPAEVFNIDVPQLEEDNTTIELPEVNASSNSNKEEKPKTEKPVEEEVKPTESPNTKPVVEKEQKTGITKEELDKLISGIRISSGKNTEKYDRDTFESPSRKYDYNGVKLTRNKYAWHVSTHLVKEDPFEYVCPYTGLAITDKNTLDFDHIVSLKTVHENCPNWWTEKEMNEYAYDQLVGVDVLNTSNRSKSAKTPAEWLPDFNIEDFCFTYLAICYKYDISMSKVDLDVCKLEILNAISSGENVEFINKFNEGTEEYKKQQKLLEEIKSK